MDSIPRIRRQLICRFESLVRTRAGTLGIGPEEFGGWVNGIVGEGIALAIARQDQWNREKGDFLHWAFLQTRNLLKKELRQQERHYKAIRAATADKESYAEVSFPDRVVLREELVGILKELTTEQQRALILYYLNGMTVAKLAEILGQPPQFVYGLLQRARKKALQIYERQQSPLDQKKETQKTFRDSVRNSAPRVYTLSEGATPNDVCD